VNYITNWRTSLLYCESFRIVNHKIHKRFESHIFGCNDSFHSLFLVQ